MSSTISFSGLSSGIDTSSWIDALVSVKQSTLTSLQASQVTEQSLLSVVNDIKSFFTSFQNSLQKLTDSKLGVASLDLFMQNLATSSNTNIATATATTDAARQSYDVLVDQLATATKATSGTTAAVTTNAALDTTLGSLGASAGTITVNNQSFSISTNDTLSTLIKKFSNVGVTASYNDSKGTFTVNTSVSDIDDGTTGLKTALKLSDKTVTGASSGTLVYANANTQFSKLGLTAGAVTIEGNNYTISKVDDTNYTIAKDGDTATNISTIGDFLSYLKNTVGADSATIDDSGNVVIRGAVLGSVTGGSNLLKVLNLSEITDRTVMDSNPITVDVSHVADADTKLSDLGITSAQTLTIAGSAKPNISTDTTLGQIEQLLKNNGVDMNISNTGVISVDTNGNEITGTLLDSLGLKTSDQGTTIQSASHPITLMATKDTLLSDLGVTNAMSYVAYDSNGNSKTGTISNTSGLSVGNFVNQLTSEGLSASFDSTTGKIKIDNGYISGTVADALGMVQTKTSVSSTATANTTLAELGATADQTLVINGGSAITYDKSTTLNTIMQAIQAAGGTATLKNGAMAVTNANLGGTVPTLLGLDANTQGTTMTSGNLAVITNATSTSSSGVTAGTETNISMSSTLGDILGTTANQNLMINGVTKNYASTATLGSINSDIQAAGGTMTINSDNTLDIAGVTLSGGLVSAFGLTSNSKATNITSNTAIKSGGTDTYATLSTTMADLGATGNSSLSINGAAGLTFDTTKTIGDVFNAITAAGGTATIKDGVVSVTGVTLTGTVPSLLKLTATNSGTSVTSGDLTYVTSSTSTSSGVLATSNAGKIDWNTTLGQMFGTTGVNYGLTYTSVSDGASHTLSYDSSTTLSSIANALSTNGVTMTINDDSSISLDGLSSATGTLATALGLDPDKYKTTAVSDGTVMVSAGIHNADANTTFDQLAVINGTLSSASSRYYAVSSNAGYLDGSGNNVTTLIQATSNNGSSGTSTIGNWLTSVNSALNTANGTTGVNYATISNGVISVTGGYVTGALADALGITSTTVNSGKIMTGSSVSYVESNMSDFIGNAVTMSGTTQGSLTVNSSGYITGTTIATGTTQGSVNVVASGYIGNVVNKTGTATQYNYTGNNLTYLQNDTVADYHPVYVKNEGSQTTYLQNDTTSTYHPVYTYGGSQVTYNQTTTGTTTNKVYTYTGPEATYTVTSIVPGYYGSATLASIFGSGVVGTEVDTDITTVSTSTTTTTGTQKTVKALDDDDTNEFSDSLTITSSTTMDDLVSFLDSDGILVSSSFDTSTGVFTTGTRMYRNGSSGTVSGTFLSAISSYLDYSNTTSPSSTYSQSTTTYDTLTTNAIVKTPTDIAGATTMNQLFRDSSTHMFTINKADGSTVNLTFNSSDTINNVISSLASNGITATISNGKLTYTSAFDWTASGDLGTKIAGTLKVPDSSISSDFISTNTVYTPASTSTSYVINGKTVSTQASTSVYAKVNTTIGATTMVYTGTSTITLKDGADPKRTLTVTTGTTISQIVSFLSGYANYDESTGLLMVETDEATIGGTFWNRILSQDDGGGSSTYGPFETTAGAASTTATLSTTMSSIYGDTSTHTFTFNNNGSAHSVTLGSTDTVQDVLDSLNVAGLTASFSGGKLTLSSTSTDFSINSITSDNAKLLGIAPSTTTAIAPGGTTVSNTQKVSDVSSFLAGATYHISTAADLMKLATLVNSGMGTTGVNFVLDNDIDMSSISNYVSIGDVDSSFEGNFYGNGHTISNLTSSSFYYSGLFGATYGGTIQDLGLTNVKVTATGDAGGLVGYANNTIINNVYLKGGSVSSADFAGGIVGNSFGGSISNSYSSLSVSTSSSYYISSAGGLVGYSYNGTIKDSYATGDVSSLIYSGGLVGFVSSGTITDAYATGNVTSSSTAGGLVGNLSSGTFTRVYSASTVISGTTRSGGLIGYASGTTSFTNAIYNSAAVSSSCGGGSAITGTKGLTYNQMKTQSTMEANGFTSANGWSYVSGLTPTLGNLTNNDISTVTTTTTTTNPITGTTTMSDLFGDSSSHSFTITKADSSQINLTFSGSQTVNDVISALSSNGISASISNGALSYTSPFTWSVSGDLGSKLTGNMSYSDQSYYTYNTVTNTYTASGSTTMSQLFGDSNAHSFNIAKSDGTNINLSFSGSQSVNDVISALSSNGISASMSDGHMSYTSAFNWSSSGDLASKLTGNLSSSDNSYYTYRTVTNTYNASGGTTLGQIYGTSNNISLSFNGYSTLNITMSASNTVNDLVNVINNSNDGITASFSNGKFVLSSYVQQSSTDSTLFAGIPSVSTSSNTLYVSGVSGFVSGDTYHISTVADLNKLASLVNGGQDTTGVTFILDNNIDMSSVSNFAGIGTSNAFKGTFDGNGHTISNLTMNSTADGVGFFGNTANGSIQDLAITNANVYGSQLHVGILSGSSIGTVISNVYTTGTAKGYDSFVGGLVGQLYGASASITNSYSTATTSSTIGDAVGGLVGGSKYATISKSYATGNVSGDEYVGGLVGYNRDSNTIKNTYATGNVTGNGSVGGLVGYNMSGSTISNSYSIGTVSGSSSTGAFVGYNDGTITNGVYKEATNTALGVGGGTTTGATSLTISQMKNSSTMQGYGFTSANGWNYNSGSLPQLGSESITNTAGSTVYVSGINNFVTGDTYHISTVADMNKLASLVNGGQDTTGVTFILDNDIDMSSVSNFAGIGNATTAFKGTFDGNGHAVSNLKMNSGAIDVGFFGSTSSATIQDLAITGANIIGGNSTGILVGSAQGGSISNVYTTGTVSGSSNVGGLVGSTPNLNITNSYSTATVGGTSYVGGLVGNYMNGTITKSYATGAVTASGNYSGGLLGFAEGAVNNSYATGNVSGSSYVGGLIGENEGSVTTAYSLGSVSGTSYVGGLLGSTVDPVTNCVYNAASYTTGVGSGSSSGVTRLSITQMSNSSTMQGLGFSTANGWKYSTGKLPTLGNETVTQSAGSTVYVSNINNLVNGDTYHIKTAADLTQLASLVNSGEDTTGVKFVLDNDIDMSSVSNFAGIGNSTTAFKGSFYGNGHTISNLKESSTVNGAGFFGYTNGATIQDLKISNATVSTTGGNAGILAGSATNTTIINSSTSGTVSGTNGDEGGLVGSASGGTITNSYSTASVSGNTMVGGLVGVSTATISKSFASGTVTGTGSNSSRLGGLVGQLMGGSITDSYASGNVNGYSQVGGLIGWSNDGAVTRTYATGKATGTSQVGGIAGNDQSRVTFTNVIYNTDLNSSAVGTTGGSGITGLTLGNMQVESTMESYGFTAANGWKYAANKTPQLQSVVSTYSVNSDTSSNLGELGANTNSELTMTVGSSSKTFTAENSVNDVLTWVKAQSGVTDATFNNSKLVVTSKTNPNLSVTGGLADILFNTGSPAVTVLTTTTNNASPEEKYIPPDVKLTTDTTIARLLHQDLTPGDAQLIIGGDVQAVLTFKATDTVQNVITSLAGYGITATVDSNGKFTATGNVNFSLAGAIGNTLMESTGTTTTTTTGYKSDIEQGTKTNNATGATLLSDLGISSGNVYIKNAQNENIGTIAIDNTLSVNQLSDLLSNYGFTASISNGKYTVTSDNGTSLADSTSNAISKLGLSTWSNSSSSLTASTTLSEMGFTDGTTLGIIKDGSTIGPISFSKTDTLQDIIDTLKVYGIDASVDSNGAFKATSTGSFVFTGDLGSYLTSKGSTGTGYITTVNGYTSSQALTDKTDVTKLTEDTTVGDLLKTGEGGLLRIIKNNSNVIEVQYGADEKVSNIISDLASIGITAGVDSNGVFTASSSDEFSLSGDVGKALLGSAAIITNKDDGYDSKDLSYTKTSTASGSTVLSDIGVNSGKIYVLDSNGKIVTSVGIDNSTTVDQTIGLLKPYGLDMSVDSNGKVTVSSEDGYTLSDGTSNLVSKLKLSTWNKTSEKLSTSTTVSQMGFKDGADLNLILDGGSTQVLSFNADDTLQDVINGLSAYGITGSVDSNGAFTATSSTHSFVMSSDLGSYLSKGTTGYVTEDTGYKTSSTLNATDPKVTETSKTLTYNTNMSLNSTMADLGFTNGASLKVTLDGKTPYTLSFLATDKISDVVYALSAYGIDAGVDGTGKFSAESTDHTFTLSGSLGGYLTSGSTGYDTEDTGYTSSAKSYTTEEKITSSTKLSDLGVAAGSLNIIQDGKVSKNTIQITKDTTVGQLFSGISSYGLNGSIKTDGSGNTYIEISANSNTKLVDGTSDLIDKLGLKDVEQGDYSGNVEYWENNPTDGGLITEDMLLSSFDKNGKKAAGSFLFTTGSGDDSTQHIVNITSDDTVGSLLKKFQDEGVTASLNDGIIHLTNGVDGITFDGGTSGLKDTIGLLMDDSETYATSTSALTYKGSETTSIANFADASTTLGTMNITDGNMSVYVNGVKCTVAVSSSDTFGGLFSKIKSAVLTKTGQTIEAGFLDKDGNIVSNPTAADNTGMVSFKVADGTKLVVGATNDTTNFATIANFEQDSTTQVSGKRSLYKVNANSLITQTGIFREGNVTAGTFTLGDAEFTIDSNTTISSLVNQINSSDKSYATAYWDTLSGTMVLQSTLTGASLMNIEAGTSNFTDMMGFTENNNGVDGLVTDSQTLGKNAVVRINGTSVSTTSNTITSDVSKIKGLTINLKGLSAGETTTITVAEDDDSIYQAVSDTVDSYNSLMKELNTQLSSSTDVANDSIIKLMRNNLKYLMTSSLTGTHVYKNLASVGVSTGSASNDLSADVSALSIDKDKFMDALSNNSDSVKDLLVGTTTSPGILLQASNIVDNALNASGYFSTYTQSINDNITKLSTKISSANTELLDYRAKLEKQFKNMESTVTSLQSAYSNFLNNVSSTSSSSSTGFGINMSTSSSTGVGISTPSTSSGVGISTSTSSSGVGIKSSSTSTGVGINTSSTSSSNGISLN